MLIAFSIRRGPHDSYALGMAYLPDYGVAEPAWNPPGGEYLVKPEGTERIADSRRDSVVNLTLCALATQPVYCWSSGETELLRELCRASDVLWHGSGHITALEEMSTLRNADVAEAALRYGVPPNWRRTTDGKPSPTPREAAVLVLRIAREMARRAKGGAA